MHTIFKCLAGALFVILPLTSLAADQTDPSFQPVGARLGNFFLYPSARIIENFDSNIYGTKNNEKSDLITVLSPRIDLRTLNTEKGASFSASTQQGFYKNHSGENYGDYAVDFLPYLTITRAMKLTGRLAWEQSHDLRTDEAATNTAGSEEPASWQRSIGRLGWEYKRSRIGVALHGQYSAYRYDNVARIGGGGQSFINDDRDRDETELGGELSCDITDRSMAYWQSTWFGHAYKHLEFDVGAGAYSGDNRDSDGIVSVIGLRFPLTGLIGADINAGYHDQNFDQDFDDIGTGIGSATLTWKATPLMTVQLTGTRQVFETNQEGASAFVQTSAALNISHELRRNIILEAQVAAGNNNYFEIDRNDDYTLAGAGATYHVNRNISLNTNYIFDVRDSNDDTIDYNRHRVFVSAKAQF